MKIFEYVIEGKYLGSATIIAAKSEEAAQALMAETAKEAGLMFFADRHKPTIYDLTEEGVIYFDDGDY